MKIIMGCRSLTVGSLSLCDEYCRSHLSEGFKCDQMLVSRNLLLKSRSTFFRLLRFDCSQEGPTIERKEVSRLEVCASNIGRLSEIIFLPSCRRRRRKLRTDTTIITDVVKTLVGKGDEVLDR